MSARIMHLRGRKEDLASKCTKMQFGTLQIHRKGQRSLLLRKSPSRVEHHAWELFTLLAHGKATQKLISMTVKRCAVLVSNQQAENGIQCAGPSIVSSPATSAVVSPTHPTLPA